MMTTLKEKQIKNEEKISEENFYFDVAEEIMLTENEIQDLEKKLKDREIDDKTRSFFKSSHQFYKKLEEKEYIVSLEEIKKL